MGPFNLIYTDPPWHFKTYTKDNAKAPPYPTMSIEEMKRLPVKSWVASDALLVMWVYDPLLSKTFELAKAWGFKKYVTVLFRWFKTTDGQMRMFDPTPTPGYGTGYHTRGGACEEVLLFKRGKGLKVLDRGIRKEFWSPLREHSRKPDEVRNWLVKLYGNVPRLEMFARQQTSGWETWGNQTDKFKTGA